MVTYVKFWLIGKKTFSRIRDPFHKSHKQFAATFGFNDHQPFALGADTFQQCTGGFACLRRVRHGRQVVGILRHELSTIFELSKANKKAPAALKKWTGGVY
jgi:hypothetical protein